MKNTLTKPWFLRVAMAVSLVVIIVVGLLPVMPIRVTPASAPQSEFSAERAMRDLQVVATQPHPAGSPTQSLVRDYILDQIQAAGATYDIQNYDKVANIFVTFPGSASTGKVMITGHYDSNVNTPGAGDDGVSVVAVLLSIYATGLLLPQVLFILSKKNALLSTNP